MYDGFRIVERFTNAAGMETPVPDNDNFANLFSKNQMFQLNNLVVPYAASGVITVWQYKTGVSSVFSAMDSSNGLSKNVFCVTRHDHPSKPTEYNVNIKDTKTGAQTGNFDEVITLLRHSLNQMYPSVECQSKLRPRV